VRLIPVRIFFWLVADRQQARLDDQLCGELSHSLGQEATVAQLD
jgi:hypothetical protein